MYSSPQNLLVTSLCGGGVKITMSGLVLTHTGLQVDWEVTRQQQADQVQQGIKMEPSKHNSQHIQVSLLHIIGDTEQLGNDTEGWTASVSARK